MKNVDEESYEVLDLSTDSFESRSDCGINGDTHTALYLKDKLAISNAGYHELSIIFNLPSSSKTKKCTEQLNAQFEIWDAPEGIFGI